MSIVVVLASVFRLVKEKVSSYDAISRSHPLRWFYATVFQYASTVSLSMVLPRAPPTNCTDFAVDFRG